MRTEYNILRLTHLLSLYKMSTEELCNKISLNLVKPIGEEQIIGNTIELSILKKIDKIFNKGLLYYLDPDPPVNSPESSIFFRKQKFNSNLNLGAITVVNRFEEQKISLSAIAKLSGFSTDRILKVFSTAADPHIVANEMRNILYPGTFYSDKRAFLKELIAKFAENNIFVFEFIETHNKIEKANIDGFFLNPNVIVIKRQQSGFRREIFTLIHELGHFLLNEEEVESIENYESPTSNNSIIERWCNDFAYYFLCGNYNIQIDEIKYTDGRNDYNHTLIKDISNNTHLSEIALFTRLLFVGKISANNYSLIKKEFNDKYNAAEDEKNKKKAMNKALGIKSGGAVPKAINSPLFISTIKTAYYQGVINEYEACRTLNVKSNQLNEMLV